MRKGLKTICFFMLCYAPTLYSGTLGNTETPHFDGWYAGANLGYLWSDNNTVTTTPTTSFFNPDFFLNGEVTRRSLVNAANNKLTLRLSDFMLGIQGGYNYQFYSTLLAGITADFDWLFPSSNSAHLNRPFRFEASGLDYTAAINAKKTLNYLGTVRGRLGTLLMPSLLAYGTGGFAYGRAALTLNTSVTNEGAPGVFPAFSGQYTRKKVLDGWTAGGGLEWMFFKNWSTHVEYLYYDLGRLTTQGALTKWVIDTGRVVPYASTNLSGTSLFTLHTVRVGVSGHFA